MENRVIELVNLWAKHAAQTPDLSIRDFCAAVLLDEIGSELIPVTEFPGAANQPRATINLLSMLVGKLSKFTHLYCKKAFQGMALTHVDDVIYLNVLHMMGTPRKTDLIMGMVAEFPSGIDVIKRLKKAGFVEEFSDKQDKRSKRLHITKPGIAFLSSAIPQLNRVAEMAFSTLNPAEQALLLRLLSQLDAHHTGHLKEVRQSGFEDAYRFLVKGEN